MLKAIEGKVLETFFILRSLNAELQMVMDHNAHCLKYNAAKTENLAVLMSNFIHLCAQS